MPRLADMGKMPFLDPLTDLANARCLRMRLAASIARSTAAEDKKPLGCICLIDIHKFSWLNDSYGDLVGNKLLKKFAERLLYVFQEADTIARQMNDQFVATFENLSSPEDATTIAERIITAMDERVDVSEFKVAMQLCIGISFFRGDEVSAESATASAAEALSQAKKLGRNRFVISHNLT